MIILNKKFEGTSNVINSSTVSMVHNIILFITTMFGKGWYAHVTAFLHCNVAGRSDFNRYLWYILYPRLQFSNMIWTEKIPSN